MHYCQNGCRVVSIGIIICRVCVYFSVPDIFFSDAHGTKTSSEIRHLLVVPVSGCCVMGLTPVQIT